MSSKETICNVCQARVEKVLFNWDNNPVMKCERCGLVFRKVVVDLSEEELFDFAMTVGDASKSPTAKYDASYREDDIRVILWEKFLKQLDRFKLSEGRKLLDIGVAKGVFLDIARKRGWEPMGIEPSEKDSSYAREVFKLPIFTGTLEEAKLPSNQFDAATMLDVIEHLKNPSETVAKAFRVLKPGGILLVFTPNHDSLIFLISHWLYRLSLGKFPLERLYPVVHVHYFTPRALSYLLGKSGFNIEWLGSGPLHPEKCLTSTRITRVGASTIEFLSKPLNRRYRIAIIGSKPLNSWSE